MEPVSLQVGPKNISLRAREAQVFQTGEASGGHIAWSIAPAAGRIDLHGIYTAPTLIARQTNVTVTARSGIQFDTATIMLDPGWFWLHFLGVYWLAWTAFLLVMLLWRWDLVCPTCAKSELLLSPPLATITASQPVRFTASEPVNWPDNVSSGGWYTAPPAEPPNATIDVTAATLSEPRKMAGATLTWSSDIGITLQPSHATITGEGRVGLNPILTTAAASQIDLSTAAVAWLQPPVGRITAARDGTAVYAAAKVRRATTIMIMANARVPGRPARAAAAYVTLLPAAQDSACQDDGTPGPVRLIALIGLAGALGGLIHGASSFAIFAGNRAFKSSWTWWYVLRPLLGGAVALIVNLVVRGGLGPGGMALGSADCFKTAGFAGLIGLFAEPATLKLKDIFDTLFTPRQDPRKDALHVP